MEGWWEEGGKGKEYLEEVMLLGGGFGLMVLLFSSVVHSSYLRGEDGC